MSSFSDVVGYIMNGEDTILPAVSKILSAVAKSSSDACSHVITLCVPSVLDQFNKNTQVSVNRFTKGRGVVSCLGFRS